MSSTLAAGSTAASSSSSTSSPRCVPFVAFRRGGTRGRRLPAPGARTVPHGGGAPAAAATGGCGGCGRPLCRPAEIVGEGIQNAFFTSLDVCSCVKVRTDSFKESESEPLMFMSPPPPAAAPHDDSGSAAASRSGRTRRASAAAGKPRRGLACCTPSST